MSILTSFAHAFERMSEKNWDCIYIAVDIHDTIFKGCYHEEEKYEWLGNSKECLQMMSNMENIRLILWSSCHPSNIEKYLKVFEENGIHFDFVNSNPEIVDDNLASYQDKFYFNIGIDDKFGFEPSDWTWILTYLKDKEYR